MQRIRKAQLENGTKTKMMNINTMIQDGFSRKKYPFPGSLCYFNHKMKNIDVLKL